ncbi:expressed unknown protein [Seminavis robusta]|uniref:Uncharacterized protein n=1 Tax=Seminavis robusta TaxID=568900 RepID=A0A9N8ESD4_9STRA|nr:expressed unknown protein [Seminavis robusta]|eukprot:Sro1510_g278650.1 n/a (429) ;mRNA; f:14197-15582
MGLLRTLSSSNPPFFGRGLGRPRRHHSAGAERRPSEMNIMGNDGVVSAEYTLKTIKQAQSNPRLTKLELEDVITRQDKDSTSIYEAIQTLLDQEREWIYIKFVDSMTLREGGDSAATLLEHYKNHRLGMWDTIRQHTHDKPIMFQVKLEVASGTPITLVSDMLTVLQQLDSLTSIDFGGGLYGVRKPDVPDQLALLCHGNNMCLPEMIMLSLSCTPPDAAPINNAAGLLHECARKLTQQRRSDDSTSEEEEEEEDVSPKRIRRKSAKKGDNTNKTMDESLTMIDILVDSTKKQRLNDDSDKSTNNTSPTRRRRRSPRVPRRQRRHLSNSERAPDPADYNWTRRRHSRRHSSSNNSKQQQLHNSAPALHYKHSSSSTTKTATKIQPDFRWDKLHQNGPVMDASTPQQPRRRSSTRSSTRNSLRRTATYS